MDSVKNHIEDMLVTLLRNNIPALIQEGVHKRTVTDNKILCEAMEFAEAGTGSTSASELYSDQNEFFDGWLPLSMNLRRAFSFSSSQLKCVRDASRVICSTNEIAKTSLTHYRNFVIGDNLNIYLVPFEYENDPKKLIQLFKNPTVKRLLSNWKQFWFTNDMHLRLLGWQERVRRDGEMFLRVFPQSGRNPPKVRFIDPLYIDGGNDAENFGLILSNEHDVESIKGYNYIGIENGEKEQEISAERIIHDKRNVDFESPRGIPSLWPVFSNIRRLEKLLINTSILSTIHTAIAFVRTFEGAGQARVQALMNRESDGVSRTNTITGRAISAKTVAPGTILNASSGMKYEFPAHNVDPSKWVAVMDTELRHISTGTLLPFEWLMSNEPVEPLTPGSPVIANFKTDRSIIYHHLTNLFWMVQGFMGERVESLRVQYDVIFEGPRLAVGKSLDEARVDDLNLKNGATSPQEIAAKNGGRYEISRAQVILHRQTAQPGEVMPGDAGNSNPQGSGGGDNGGDGLSKKNNKGQRSGDASGGNNQ